MLYKCCMSQPKRNFGLYFNFSLEKNKALRGLNILNLRLKPLGKVLFSLYLYRVLSFNINNSCDLNNKVHNLLHIILSQNFILFVDKPCTAVKIPFKINTKLIQKLHTAIFTFFTKGNFSFVWKGNYHKALYIAC